MRTTFQANGPFVSLSREFFRCTSVKVDTDKKRLVPYLYKDGPALVTKLIISILVEEETNETINIDRTIK